MTLPELRATMLHRIRPVWDAVTPVGWIAVAGVMVLGGFGAWRGWLEFRVAAVVAFIALLAAGFLARDRGSLGVDLRLDPSRVTPGATAFGRVGVRNETERPTAPVEVELPVGPAVAAFGIGRLAPGDEAEQLFQIPARRRGVIKVGPVRSVRSDPLGLLRSTRERSGMVELFVHPRTVRMAAGAVGLLRDIEGVTTANLSSSDVSFHALRPYVPGDDRRSVHWRTTARTGRLMVRQFEETMRSHLLLVLDTDPAAYATGDDFELAISAAASVALAALTAGRAASVVTSAGELAFASPTGLLDALTRLEPDARARSLREVALIAHRAVPAASVAGFVTGSVRTASDLRGAELVLPGELAVFALRCDAALPPARRTSGRLVAIDLADLEGLPRAMRTLR